MAQFKRDGKSADGMRMEFCKIKDRLEGCARWGERPLWYGRLREHAGRSDWTLLAYLGTTSTARIYS